MSIPTVRNSSNFRKGLKQLPTSRRRSLSFRKLELQKIKQKKNVIIKLSPWCCSSGSEQIHTDTVLYQNNHAPLWKMNKPSRRHETILPLLKNLHVRRYVRSAKWPINAQISWKGKIMVLFNNTVHTHREHSVLLSSQLLILAQCWTGNSGFGHYSKDYSFYSFSVLQWGSKLFYTNMKFCTELKFFFQLKTEVIRNFSTDLEKVLHAFQIQVPHMASETCYWPGLRGVWI